MNLKIILQQLTEHYKQKKPFVLYAHPEGDTVEVLLQENTVKYTSEKFDEQGIVMAPFKYEGQTICIPFKASQQLSCDLSEAFQNQGKIKPKTVELDSKTIEKEEHMRLVSKALKAINRKHIHKVVVSRKKEVPIEHIDFSSLVPRLLRLYPTAFRYVWYHPETGLWCGATPEVLLVTQGGSFTTMALAGTKNIADQAEPDWTPKELNEQQVVTDVMSNCLQKVTSVLRVSKPYTHEAGSLAHLRTDITGMLKNKKTTLTTITAALHPTPAVCGTPLKEATDFIVDNEGYDREYYTGFIGSINDKDSRSCLYVNLRCMKLEDDKAYLYVGGGITFDSQPEDEWEETQNKLQTMLQVLQPML
ncbi:isochorismate synthase [Marixanthomonas spongiae]|uniref:isochorismate synthase n=1 Tax=Marixanthomonas spongiae TaxID=2174845 RepID=A0A2U0I3W1_9FLAO|nr:isochorismate synthase [Marixanthomonas spongiae]PVW15802.1 isochorismate synthase [Marixanthomonas spongiae]